MGQDQDLNEDQKYFECTKLRATILTGACEKNKENSKYKLSVGGMEKAPRECKTCQGWETENHGLIDKEVFEKPAYEGLDLFPTEKGNEREEAAKYRRLNMSNILGD